MVPDHVSLQLILLDPFRAPPSRRSPGLDDDVHLIRDLSLQKLLDVLGSEPVLRFQVGSAHIKEDGAVRIRLHTEDILCPQYPGRRENETDQVQKHAKLPHPSRMTDRLSSHVPLSFPVPCHT